MTYYDATFWVGANAVIRKAALDDICVVSTEGTRTVKTYIQDRTVIEDTESSIDLGYFGWHLVNYPERLSYSATPPDFGSLVVQRRRWANGGLLIIGKFFRIVHARHQQGNDVKLGGVHRMVEFRLDVPLGLSVRPAVAEPVGGARVAAVFLHHVERFEA